MAEKSIQDLKQMLAKVHNLDGADDDWLVRLSERPKDMQSMLDLYNSLGDDFEKIAIEHAQARREITQGVSGGQTERK